MTGKDDTSTGVGKDPLAASETAAVPAFPGPASRPDSGHWRHTLPGRVVARMGKAARRIGTLIATHPGKLMVALILGSVLLPIGYREWNRQSILIEPFEVPKALQEQGYTGRALATKLVDKLNQIARAQPAKEQGKRGFIRQGSQAPLEVEIPGFKLSITAVMNLLLEAFKRNPPHILSEIVASDKGQLLLTTRVDDFQEGQFRGRLKDLDAMLLDAARGVYRVLRPSDLAFYETSEGNYSAAIDAIEAAVRKEDKGEQIRAYTLWGELLSDDGRNEEALNKLRSAIGLKSTSRFSGSNVRRALSYAHNVLGWIYLERLARYDEAVTRFQEAIRLDRKNPWPHLNWGLVWERQGQLQTAGEKYKEALRIDDRLAMAHNNLGALQMYRGDLDGAIQKFQAAIVAEPNLLLAYTNSADVLARLGREAEALAKFEEAEKTLGQDPSLYTAWGNFLVQRRAYRQAEQKYQRAIALNRRFSGDNPTWAHPRSAEAYTAWGRSLEEQGRYQEALQRHAQAVKAHPRIETGHVGLARSLWKLKRDREAIAELKEAINLSASPYPVLAEWGDLLLDRGDPDAAIDKYEAAVRINPWYSGAYRMWGVALERKGTQNWELAVTQYRRAIQVAPGEPENRNYLGHLLVRMGRHKDAIELAQQELELNPNSAGAYLVWGMSLVAVNAHPEARQKLERSLKIDPTNAATLELLADALLATGEEAKAKKYLEEGCRLHSESACSRLTHFPRRSA